MRVVGQERPPGLTRRAGRSAPAVPLDRAVADHDPELEQLTPDALGAPQAVLARHRRDQFMDLRAEMRPSASRAGPPTPEESPALPMPAHDCVRRDERQVLAPVGTPSPSQDPEQLVPGAQPRTRSGSSRPGKDGELMPQQQVLGHEVLARPNPGQHGSEQQPEEFEHALSIADFTRATFCRPTTPHRDRYLRHPRFWDRSSRLHAELDSPTGSWRLSQPASVRR